MELNIKALVTPDFILKIVMLSVFVMTMINLDDEAMTLSVKLED